MSKKGTREHPLHPPGETEQGRLIAEFPLPMTNWPITKLIVRFRFEKTNPFRTEFVVHQWNGQTGGAGHGKYFRWNEAEWNDKRPLEALEFAQERAIGMWQNSFKEKIHTAIIHIRDVRPETEL